MRHHADRRDRTASLELPAARTSRSTAAGCASRAATAAELLDHPERLTTPLVRGLPRRTRSGPRAGTTRSTGSPRRSRRTQAAHGRDAVGAFGGGGLTNEKAYQFGKFARVALRSRDIDYNGRFCMSSAARAGNRAFGIDRGLPFPLDDIAEADVARPRRAATRPTRCRPPCSTSTTGRERGARHVVVDPRRTATAELAPHRTCSRCRAPTSRWPTACCTSRSGRAWSTRSTSPRAPPGSTPCAGRVRAYWPDRVERITGIAVDRPATTVVRALAAAPTGDDPDRPRRRAARRRHRHRAGVDQPRARARPARRGPGSGWGTITGQGNGQGGREHGQKADQLPGYRSLTNPADRAHVAAVWGVDPDELPGARACRPTSCSTGWAPTAACGRCWSARPTWWCARRTPRHVEKRLQALDFLVVTDIFLSETAAARRRRAAHHPVGRGGAAR